MSLQGFAYREGDLVVANIALDSSGRATTRYAIVEPASRHGEALTLVDVEGKELTGRIVSCRLMSEEEIHDWNCFKDSCPECGDELSDLGAHGRGCAACADRECDGFADERGAA